MSDVAWMRTLKPGDEVFIESRNCLDLRRVAKAGNAFVAIEINERYSERWSLKTGRCVGGDSWTIRSLLPVSAKNRERYERQCLASEVLGLLDAARNAVLRRHEVTAEQLTILRDAARAVVGGGHE